MFEATARAWARAARRARLVPVACAVAVLLGAPGAGLAQEGLSGPAEGESIAAWTARWMEGPVQLIATTEEKEVFGSLESTHERLQFIRLFWERRDPQVRGPRNEFLDQFAERLAYVEERYASPRAPGWDNNIFAKVVLLFGPPDRTRRELSLPAGFSDRPPILWAYDERIPGLEANEEMLFVFRAGRWKLMPQYPTGPTAVPEYVRQAERNDVVGDPIPTDYRLAMDEVIEESLAQLVDYRAAIDDVTSSVQLPDAQIPFSYSTRLAAGADGKVRVSIDITWSMDSLIFHLAEQEFTTDMLVEAELVQGGEPMFVASERVAIAVPEAEMEDRRQDAVRRTLELTAEPGEYELRLTLLDQLLGFRTVYRNDVEVR